MDLNPEKPIIRCAGYVRISPRNEQQMERTISIEAQMEFIKTWCKHEGWRLIDRPWFVDEFISSKDINRKGLIDSLVSAEAGEYDFLMVYHNDRLSRNLDDLRDLLTLYDRFHVSVLFGNVPSLDPKTPGGELMLNLLGSFSQYYRQSGAIRTSSAMRMKASQGYHMGRPPWGCEIVNSPDSNLRGALRVVDKRVYKVFELFDKLVPQSNRRSKRVWGVYSTIAEQLGIPKRSVWNIVKDRNVLLKRRLILDEDTPACLR